MQYTSQLPSYFHDRDKASHYFSQHTFAGKVSSFMDQRGYNTFAHHNIPLHQYLSYDKETIRRIIHYQDETFRCQVQELHRLYRRQRELMDDTTMRQIFMRDLQSQTSKSAQCLSQAQTKAEEKLSSKFFIDLNEPLVAEPEPLASSSTGSCSLMRNFRENRQAKEEAKSEAAVVKTRLDFDIDLNSVPPNFASESYIDLNANGEKEMEVPFSPYNNSLETQREGKKVQEHAATAAAEALLSIFSSARNSRKSVGDVISEDSKSSSNPLSWFADVIISSVGEEGNVCHDQSLLFKGKARYPFRVVRNETKSAAAAAQPLKSKRVAARNMTRDNIEGSKEMGSLMRGSAAGARKRTELSSSYDLRKKQSVLHDWGKIKKRQEGFRRRSTYQVKT